MISFLKTLFNSWLMKFLNDEKSAHAGCHVIQSSLAGVYPKKRKSVHQRDVCTTTIVAALFSVVKIQKQPKCPSDIWIKKMWYIYTMEYHSAMKESKIQSFAMTWMELEIILLSEISQAQKDVLVNMWMLSKLISQK